MADIDGPGSGDLFDPWDVDDVRRRVVEPVVRSLIRPADLERCDVGWGPRESLEYAPDGPPDDELWVVVTAAGATWHSQLWQIEDADQLDTVGSVAWRLADQLEDWICEKVYWGEQVNADVSIPARGSTAV